MKLIHCPNVKIVFYIYYQLILSMRMTWLNYQTLAQMDDNINEFLGEENNSESIDNNYDDSRSYFIRNIIKFT